MLRLTYDNTGRLDVFMRHILADHIKSVGPFGECLAVRSH